MSVWLKNIMLVGIGGFTGSVCRYLISIMISGMHPFPLATFGVNAAGSFLIGLLMAVISGNSWHLLLAVGFCGGFTTFSTFSAETLELFRNGNHLHAYTYIASSIIVCLLAVWGGVLVGERIK